MLFSKSNEFGLHDGLDIIEGEVKSLDLYNKGSFKIPNVGWRSLIINSKNNIINNEFDSRMFYFVHSFVPEAKDLSKVSSFIKFNDTLIHASLHYKNIVGFQFHPEKSGVDGLNLLSNSVDYLLNKV